MNLYNLFNLPQQFEVDLNLLEKKYLEAQMQFHPDKMRLKSEAEKIEILRKSADINEGYKVLKNPIKRIEHLLFLEKIFVAKEKDNSFKPSQKLLMLQMEISEKLEDTAEDRQKIKLEIEDLQNSAFKNFNKYYTEKAFEKAAQEYFLLKFIDRLNLR